MNRWIIVFAVALAILAPAAAPAQTFNIVNTSAYSWLRVSLPNTSPLCVGPQKGGAMRFDVFGVNERVRVEVMQANCAPPVLHSKVYLLELRTEKTEITLTGSISCKAFSHGRWDLCVNG